MLCTVAEDCILPYDGVFIVGRVVNVDQMRKVKECTGSLTFEMIECN